MFYIGHAFLICNNTTIYMKEQTNMRRVRLTEGQLNNVIREYVSQILNEPDWKTYDNANLKTYKKQKNSDYRNYVDIFHSARNTAIAIKYPHAWVEGFDADNMSPEAQKEFCEFRKEMENQVNDKYKYEKGGRGYYLDDED